MSKGSKTETTTANIADIYVRVSGEYDERTASLDSQERACRELVEANGYEVGQLFIERMTGQSLHKRKELTKLRERVSNGETQCVAFYDLDRFTRGGSGHIWILIHECRERGIALLCPNMDLSDTPMNNMMISIKAEMARQELDNIRERTLRGRKEKLRKGILPGQGGDMIGYRINRETWKREIHEEEAEIIRRIFEEAASGKSYRRITLDLAADDIPSPGELLGKNYKTGVTPRWHRSAVATIIHNPAYAGTTLAQVWAKDSKTGRKFRRDPAEMIELDDVTPAIVSKELWERANETRGTQLSADETRNERNFILLRGLVFCRRCQRKMRPKSARSFWSFRCSSRTDESLGSCGAPTVSIRWLTQRVWDKMRLEFRKPDALRKMIGDLSNQGEAKDRLLKDQERLEKRIAELDGRVTRLLRMVSLSDDANVTELYHREIASLSEERRGVEESMEEIQLSIHEVEESMPDVPTLIDLHNSFIRGEDAGWSDEDKRQRMILGGFRVYVDGREADIRMVTGEVVAKIRPTDLVAFSSGSSYIPP
jgi:site-specific DNA recombinase